MVDAVHLTFIDSNGLGCLLKAIERMEEKSPTLPPGEASRPVLSVTGLIDRFQIEDL